MAPLRIRFVRQVVVEPSFIINNEIPEAAASLIAANPMAAMRRIPAGFYCTILYLECLLLAGCGNSRPLAAASDSAE
jgi:hypothetical protein